MFSNASSYTQQLVHLNSFMYINLYATKAAGMRVCSCVNESVSQDNRAEFSHDK